MTPQNFSKLSERLKYPPVPSSIFGYADTTVELLKFLESGGTFRHKHKVSPMMTIGYGHRVMLGAYLPNPMSRDYSLKILHIDLRNVCNRLRPLIRADLDPWQQDVVISWAFSVLQGGADLPGESLESCALLGHLNSGMHHLVGAELEKWVVRDGRPRPYLIERRRIERALYESGGLHGLC